MGKVVKTLTGHTTQKTKTSESSSANTSSQSWLQSNPQYQALETKAINEAGNFNMPLEQMAGLTPEEISGLSDLARGVDTSGYSNAYNTMQGIGTENYNQGSATLNSARDTLSRLGNLSQSDYQNMMKNEYNSQLVNEQIAGLTQDVQDQEAHSVQALNWAAGASGGMGNSRAGVAQGVIAGKAANAIASGSVQFRTAEEQAASERLGQYLNLQSNTAGQLANIGYQQQQTGLGAFGQSMNYYDSLNSALTQNAQNRFTAGQYQRNYNQQVLEMQNRNNVLQQSPAMARLGYLNQYMLPLANLQTTGQSSGTSTTTNTQSGGANLLGGLLGAGASAATAYFGGGAAAQQFAGMGGSIFGNSFGR